MKHSHKQKKTHTIWLLTLLLLVIYVPSIANKLEQFLLFQRFWAWYIIQPEWKDNKLNIKLEYLSVFFDFKVKQSGDNNMLTFEEPTIWKTNRKTQLIIVVKSRTNPNKTNYIFEKKSQNNKSYKKMFQLIGLRWKKKSKIQ